MESMHALFSHNSFAEQLLGSCAIAAQRLVESAQPPKPQKKKEVLRANIVDALHGADTPMTLGRIYDSLSGARHFSRSDVFSVLQNMVKKKELVTGNTARGYEGYLLPSP